MAMFQCSVCSYIFDGSQAPDECPKCGAKKEKFDKLKDDKEKLVHSSRRTNDIHQELTTLMCTAIEIAEEGVEENLDPNCIAIFTKIIDDAKVAKQLIKAEIKGHMDKGKWG